MVAGFPVKQSRKKITMCEVISQPIAASLLEKPRPTGMILYIRGLRQRKPPIGLSEESLK